MSVELLHGINCCGKSLKRLPELFRHAMVAGFKRPAESFNRALRCFHLGHEAFNRPLKRCHPALNFSNPGHGGFYPALNASNPVHGAFYPALNASNPGHGAFHPALKGFCKEKTAKNSKFLCIITYLYCTKKIFV